ncbi:MAG TPA: VWA domain-containing protein [Vicinamibacterales bacterium]|jgi:Ca-activated chloride channel family protein|nr:VWA domain-containing protein [Vicinamibacterales bacterium]
MTRLHVASAVALIIVVTGRSVNTQRFKSGTIGVRVDVLVTHGKELVRGLTARDFELRDEGVLQNVSEIEVEQIPLNLILAFDTSGSVAGDRLRSLVQAGQSLLDRLRPDDRVALVSFATRVRLLAPLTPSRQQIQGAFATLAAQGATSLRDAAFAALALRDADPVRTLVLIFSDGADTASWLGSSAVIEAAKRTDAVVYAVAIAEQRNAYAISAKSGTSGIVQRTVITVEEAGKFLDHLTEETGGRVMFANSNKDLRATFTQTLAEFRDRYVLSYTPTGVSPTGWHRLDVKLKGKSGKVTARRGYFAE